MSHVIKPNWSAPPHIKAYSTLRSGGVSHAPYHTFNLAHHVGDEREAVQQNRELLKKTLGLPADPIWMEQTHSTIALPAIPENYGKNADAAFTQEVNRICVIMTADCLPILLCDREGTTVAAIHAGWRGLANGVIESTLAAMNFPNQNLLAWLGPAIGPSVFEVGEEVRQLFIDAHKDAMHFFKPSPNQRWLADIYGLARLRLQQQGVIDISGGEYCTYSDKESFFSYRRDGNKTGRMASLIYIDVD